MSYGNLKVIRKFGELAAISVVLVACGGGGGNESQTPPTQVSPPVPEVPPTTPVIPVVPPTTPVIPVVPPTTPVIPVVPPTTPVIPAAPLDVVIFEGDSLASVTSINYWPTSIAGALDASVRRYVTAVPGTTTAQINARYMVGVYAYRPIVTSYGVLFFCAGTNDLLATSLSAEEILANLKKEWTQAHIDGFKVVAFTMHSSSHNNEKVRLELNALIRANSLAYDEIIELDKLFPDIDDKSLLIDGVHFTSAGNALVANEAAKVLAHLKQKQ